jgi:putative inorganic carbon (HCO3(-)) transporter
MTARLFDGRGIVIPACLLALPLGFATAKAPVLAAVGLAAVLMLALVLAWAEAVLLVLVAILPWEEMLQFPSEAVSLVKVVGLLLMAAYVLRALSQHEQLRLPGTLTAVLVFGLFVGLSLMLSTDPADGVIKTLRYALFITFFFLVVQLVRDRAMVIRVLGAITISCALASLYALAAFLQGEIARAGGPLREPVDFAYLIVAVLPIAGYLFARDSSRRVLWGACFMVMFGAMLAALSRGAVIGLAAMAVWIVASGRVPIGGVLTALVGFVTVLLVAFTFWGDLIHERLDEKGRVGAANVESRAAFWASAADLAMENPLTGVGARSLRARERRLRSR